MVKHTKGSMDRTPAGSKAWVEEAVDSRPVAVVN